VAFWREVTESGLSPLRGDSGEFATLRPATGDAFCLVQWECESAVPSPVRFGAAGASRADQLCLDIPASDFDRERSFWAALTGISPATGSRPEFTVLPRPEGIPVRLLLQRRSDAAPGDRVTGHVDFACADRQRLADAHTGAGARALATFAQWIVLADPVGREYCLTGRDPRTGIRPALPGRSLAL
jgi:Glyoxalase-like domain